jgi:hypothetical protein
VSASDQKIVAPKLGIIHGTYTSRLRILFTSPPTACSSEYALIGAHGLITPLRLAVINGSLAGIP